MKVFLDTNIIIDFCAKREPFFQKAHIILSLAKERKITVFVSSLTIINAMYLLRKEITKAVAKEKLQALISICQISIVGQKEIHQAFALDWTDFEDSVQFLSAKSANANIIITRNTKDFPQEEIEVMMPEDFLDEFYDELAD